MRVLGIDPGTLHMGAGVVDSYSRFLFQKPAVPGPISKEARLSFYTSALRRSLWSVSSELSDRLDTDVV